MAMRRERGCPIPPEPPQTHTLKLPALALVWHMASFFGQVKKVAAPTEALTAVKAATFMVHSVLTAGAAAVKRALAGRKPTREMAPDARENMMTKASKSYQQKR